MKNAPPPIDLSGERPAVRDIGGFKVFPGFVGADAQVALVADLRGVVRDAPLFSPMTPYGKPMRVRMTSAGRFGWISDRSGYRYAERHPSGVPWATLPQSVLEIWRKVVGPGRDPECCLLNFYGQGAGMGLHQDRDEADFTWPVVSVSLGDDALFRIGGLQRSDKTQSLWLRSGDVVVMSGRARLAYHGIDRIAFGTSTLLKEGGRINLTMRVVT